MDDSNFGFDEQGKTVLLDFAEIGLVPVVFVAYTLSPKKFASTAAALGLSDEFNNSMVNISSVLWMAGSPKLGALGLNLI